MLLFLQVTVAMVSDDRLGSAFRLSNLRLQGTVAGSTVGYIGMAVLMVSTIRVLLTLTVTISSCICHLLCFFNVD